jgi:hypothetical protein
VAALQTALQLAMSLRQIELGIRLLLLAIELMIIFGFHVASFCVPSHHDCTAVSCYFMLYLCCSSQDGEKVFSQATPFPLLALSGKTKREPTYSSNLEAFTGAYGCGVSLHVLTSLPRAARLGRAGARGTLTNPA